MYLLSSVWVLFWCSCGVVCVDCSVSADIVVVGCLGMFLWCDMFLFLVSLLFSLSLFYCSDVVFLLLFQ